jgi:hypothetical protein
MRRRTYKQQFNAKYNQPLDQPNSLEDISRLTGYQLKGLKTIFEKGEGAFYSNPQSVRKGITSPQQWAYARLYAAVNPNSKAHRIDGVHLVMGFRDMF